jgi:hypothetical protein
MEINGKKVVDATKPLRIVINADDAERGTTKDPSACAAARAILRGYKKKGVKNARVHLGRVYLEYPDKWVRYLTPDSLRAEIISFDRGNTAKFMEGAYTLHKVYRPERFGARDKPQGRTSTSVLAPSKRPKIARSIHQIEGVRAHGANR